MQFQTTKCLCLSAAICLNSISLFATKATHLDNEHKPATAAIETELFRSQPKPKVNQPQSVTEVKTARGKLGRKNRESTEKLSFTEVDFSKYESGQVFAELKVGAGGCDAALVTTTAPTQDRAQLLEYTRAGSGGSRTEKLFDVSAGYFSYRGQRVRSFYVSGALIPIGIIAWWEKDCVGSYEIRVYIKNAKISSPSPRKEPPCGDPAIQVDYDKRSPKYHKYGPYETQICVRGDRNCNLKSVFSMMISQVRFVTPRIMSSSPVKHCMEVDASHLPGVDGNVRFVINSSNLSISNYTLKDRHEFHPGVVIRTIREKNGAIYVITSGEGTGDYKKANEFISKPMWDTVDSYLKTAVMVSSGKPIQW